MADKNAVVLDKAVTVVIENRALITEALGLMTASKKRTASKVKNPIILHELDLEMDKLEEIRRAVNTL